LLLLLVVWVGADEIRLHVVNTTFGIHQVLVRLAFDLNLLHHDAIDHVDRFTILLIISVVVLRQTRHLVLLPEVDWDLGIEPFSIAVVSYPFADWVRHHLVNVILVELVELLTDVQTHIGLFYATFELHFCVV
jgi:hypothetical protein